MLDFPDGRRLAWSIHESYAKADVAGFNLLAEWFAPERYSVLARSASQPLSGENVDMGTTRPVRGGSKFCRDCGEPTVTIAGDTTCVNLNRPCENLGRERRRFCEHCAAANPGPDRCANCQTLPTHP